MRSWKFPEYVQNDFEKCRANHVFLLTFSPPLLGQGLWTLSPQKYELVLSTSVANLQKPVQTRLKIARRFLKRIRTLHRVALIGF